MKIRHMLIVLIAMLGSMFIAACQPVSAKMEPFGCQEVIGMFQNESIPPESPCEANQALWNVILKGEFVSEEKWQLWFSQVSPVYREPKNSQFFEAFLKFEEQLLRMQYPAWEAVGIDYPDGQTRLTWQSGNEKLVVWGSSEWAVVTYMSDRTANLTLICNEKIYSVPQEQPATLEKLKDTNLLASSCYVMQFESDGSVYWHAGLLKLPASASTPST